LRTSALSASHYYFLDVQMIISTPPNQSMRTSPSFPFRQPNIPIPLQSSLKLQKGLMSLESSKNSEANGEHRSETSSHLRSRAGEWDNGWGSDGSVGCSGSAGLFARALSLGGRGRGNKSRSRGVFCWGAGSRSCRVRAWCDGCGRGWSD
jgi:hypothetical protein